MVAGPIVNCADSTTIGTHNHMIFIRNCDFIMTSDLTPGGFKSVNEGYRNPSIYATVPGYSLRPGRQV